MGWRIAEPGILESRRVGAYTRSVLKAVIGRTIRRQPTRRQWVADFVIRASITATGVWAAAQLIDGIRLEGWGSTIVVALILGTLNAFLKPILFWATALLSIVTFGLFAVLINTALLAITAWTAGQFGDVHFAIDSFWDALWGAVIISLVSLILSRFIDVDRLARRFN
jgi:putative membrane protein